MRREIFNQRCEAFEEDIDGDEAAIFLADEISGVAIVHADAGGGVLEDEVVVPRTCG